MGIHKQGRQGRTRAHANEGDACNRDLRNNSGSSCRNGSGNSCNNGNSCGYGGCMGPFLIAHSLPRLKRELKGVISPACPLAQNASGQASSSLPTPSLTSNASRRGFLMMWPSPRPKRKWAYSWPLTPSVASNVSQRFYFILLLLYLFLLYV